MSTRNTCAYNLASMVSNAQLTPVSPVKVLPEEPTIRSACPVTCFIAMALADNVLVLGNTFKDLASQKVPAGALTYRFRYKPEPLERPIMRSTHPNGSLSENRVLTYDTSNCALKGLGQRSGYEENLSAYCFRRAFARSIFRRKSSYTA